MPKSISNADLLSLKFLDTAREFQANVELIKVLKSRTYQIGAANVLVRASSDGNNNCFAQNSKIYTPAECSSDILKPDKQPLPVLWQALPLF